MSGFSFGSPQTTASTGFGAMQPTQTQQNTPFGGQAQTQLTTPFGGQAPTPQSTPFGGFGTPTASVAPAPAPTATLAPTATSTGGVLFGSSAPPYGAQTTNAAAAPPFSFGPNAPGTATAPATTR